jgi:hypothetical protein
MAYPSPVPESSEDFNCVWHINALPLVGTQSMTVGSVKLPTMAEAIFCACSRFTWHRRWWWMELILEDAVPYCCDLASFMFFFHRKCNLKKCKWMVTFSVQTCFWREIKHAWTGDPSDCHCRDESCVLILETTGIDWLVENLPTHAHEAILNVGAKGRWW